MEIVIVQNDVRFRTNLSKYTVKYIVKLNIDDLDKIFRHIFKKFFQEPDDILLKSILRIHVYKWLNALSSKLRHVPI